VLASAGSSLALALVLILVTARHWRRETMLVILGAPRLALRAAGESRRRSCRLPAD